MSALTFFFLSVLVLNKKYDARSTASLGLNPTWRYKRKVTNKNDTKNGVLVPKRHDLY